MSGFWRLAFLPVLALGFGVSVASAEATPPADPAANAGANGANGANAGAIAAAPERPVVKVAGFRSAHFGMTEAEVRAAIVQDFNLAGGAVTAGQNPAERTRLLTATVPDLLPSGGTARIVYVFGYQGHKLIQVGVLWSKAVDPALAPEMLISDAAALQALFLADNYRPSTVVTNVAFANGNVTLFQGEDADGHMTKLVMEGSTAGSGAAKQFTPTALNLIHVVDAQHPDVLKLKAGSF